jgi:hypothetical protein
MRRTNASTLLAVLACGVIGLAAAPAYGKGEMGLAPIQKGSKPGFSGGPSSLKIDGKNHLTGKLRDVVDNNGHRVTTSPTDPTDDYSIEVDLTVPSTSSSGTVTVKFDLKNGNARFKTDISTNSIFSSAAQGAGVAVNGVRVKNGAGTVIGVGGYTLR